MRNLLFQTFWFFIRPFFPRKDPTLHGLAAFGERLLLQVKVAKWFGEIKNAFIGDSNSEKFTQKRNALRMRGISLFLGIGGMRLDDWVKFLKNHPVGQQIYAEIKDCKLYCNAGGNNALQNVMGPVEESIISLIDMFHEIIFVNVPCVHYSLLEKVGYDRDDLDRKIREINFYMDKHSRIPVIDAYNLTREHGTEEGGLGWFEDPIHYSRIAEIVFMEIFRGIEKYPLWIMNFFLLVIVAISLSCKTPQRIVVDEASSEVTREIVSAAERELKNNPSEIVTLALNACRSTIESRDITIRNQAKKISDLMGYVKELEESVSDLSLRAGVKDEIDDSREHNLYMLGGVISILALLLVGLFLWKK